jgi:hypothetical protein
MDLEQQAFHRTYLRSYADHMEELLRQREDAVGMTAAYERWRLRVALRRARRAVDRGRRGAWL